MSEHVRLFVSFPEELVDRPMIYEVVKRFDVVPNIRRANVEDHSGWVILELNGAQDHLDGRDRLPRRGGLHRQHHGRRRHRGMTPSPEETRHLRLLAESGAAIVAGVTRELPGWVERQVTRILDAWGRADRGDARTGGARRGDGGAGRGRPGRARSCTHSSPSMPASSAPRRCRSCGVRTASPPQCWRRPGSRPSSASEFDERAWPDDRYGLVIHDLGALGDEELAPLHFAWGMAKAGVLRARADAPVTDL